jgi:predicted NUDIX family phosphoesterase
MIKNELIAVATKENIFKNIKYEEGFIPPNENIINNIVLHHTQLSRHLAELDYTQKQIVSYIIFVYQENIFLMERSKNSCEQKLKNKFSLGIGGHLNKTDLQKDILLWGMREFNEEVNYTNDFRIELLGIINDESNDIGKLHLGIVYLMKACSSKITIKSELKSGKLISLAECLSYHDKLESWSQLVIDFIKNKNTKNLFY